MCRLCGSANRLRNSHIIPKFIGRWMKDTGVSPYFRSADSIDRRLQDLPKMKLLCDSCENMFSAWESEFAKNVFYPYADNGKSNLRYRHWLIKFAASLTWRTMQHMSSEDSNDDPELDRMLGEMENHLASFLLGGEKNVGQYTHHIYPLSLLADPVGSDSPMLNRYLATAVDQFVLTTNKFSEVLVYVKLPKFMIFGICSSPNRKLFETSRIKQSSTLHPKEHILDSEIWKCLVKRSDQMFDSFNTMSSKSKEVAEKALLNAIENHPDRIADSKLVEAMSRDHQFYGRRAIVFKDD